MGHIVLHKDFINTQNFKDEAVSTMFADSDFQVAPVDVRQLVLEPLAGGQRTNPKNSGLLAPVGSTPTHTPVPSGACRTMGAGR